MVTSHRLSAGQYTLLIHGVPVDGNEVVSIWSRELMVEAKGMHDLVTCSALVHGAAIVKLNELLTSSADRLHAVLFKNIKSKKYHRMRIFYVKLEDLKSPFFFKILDTFKTNIKRTTSKYTIE